MIYNSQAVPHHGHTLNEVSRDLLMDVWREICHQPELSKSVVVIAKMLASCMPVGLLRVQRIDKEAGCLETVGSAAVRPTTHATSYAKTELSRSAMDELLVWHEAGEVLHCVGKLGRSPMADLLSPAELHDDVLLGSLGGGNRPIGVMLLAAENGHTFCESDIMTAKMLLEPLSVALENHRRVHEMFALQAAAEADKRSLLTRLGRKELADTIVGADSGLAAVMQRVKLVARSNASVLILGETGTGKELIARAIHRQSPRRDGPFIRVNCGAIPAELIDSQLFGHERGAFTGAVDSHQGWFEQADGGTLLLDEIGELPPAAQVRLLRILQDGCLERVGGHQQVKVDVRIVTATHRDLAEMIAEGRFRADLWYRIAVFPMSLPSLRDRVEDIPALANHFARRAATRFVLPLVLPTPDDIEILASYSWPGNIRELASVIDRSAILGNGKQLEVGKAIGLGHGPLPAAAGRKPRQHDNSAAVMPLDLVVKRHIETVLSLTKGCIEGRRGAASLLQINPHTLRGRMRKLEIDWSRFREEDVC